MRVRSLSHSTAPCRPYDLDSQAETPVDQPLSDRIPLRKGFAERDDHHEVVGLGQVTTGKRPVLHARGSDTRESEAMQRRAVVEDERKDPQR